MRHIPIVKLLILFSFSYSLLLSEEISSLENRDTFVLKLQTLDSIFLEPDTLPIQSFNSPSFIIAARGYDSLGNYMPDEIFSWTNDSSLFDFNINVNGIQIYIDPSDATDDQEGWIHVTGISNTNVFNKIYMKIIGPKAELLEAKTDDLNGNGFLDIIHLTFDKSFSIPTGYDPGNIIVQKNPTENIFLVVDSITVAPLSDNKKFYLHLNEEEFIGPPRDSIPHSNWTPELTINDLNTIKPIIRETCKDGAPPVIWKVVKRINDVHDYTKDVVTVNLTERFYNADGSAFLSSNPVPPEVFNVWIKPTLTDFIKIDSILAGIEKFEEQKDDWTTFKMSNGQNLDEKRHLLNINYNNTFIADKNGNIPYITNHKVRVYTIGGIGDIFTGPFYVNPTYEFYDEEKDLPLTIINPTIANGRINVFGGTFIGLEFFLDSTFCNLNGELVVHDMDGYVINQKNSKKILQSIIPIYINTYYRCLFYWDGLNNNGEKAKEGTHYISLRLNNDKIKIEGTRKICIKCIKPNEPYDKNEDSMCGTGISLALLPPLGIKLTGLYRKRKKRKRSISS